MAAGVAWLTTALWGNHLPHYQSRLSQLERVCGVQMTPVNSYLSDLLPGSSRILGSLQK